MLQLQGVVGAVRYIRHTLDVFAFLIHSLPLRTSLPLFIFERVLCKR